jgi:hypothetical protein
MTTVTLHNLANVQATNVVLHAQGGSFGGYRRELARPWSIDISFAREGAMFAMPSGIAPVCGSSKDPIQEVLL